MDCFLSEGIETIFRIALTLLMIAKHELLLLDMEGVIKYFQVNDSPKTFDYLWICIYILARWADMYLDDLSR